MEFKRILGEHSDWLAEQGEPLTNDEFRAIGAKSEIIDYLERSKLYQPPEQIDSLLATLRSELRDPRPQKPKLRALREHLVELGVQDPDKRAEESTSKVGPMGFDWNSTQKTSDEPSTPLPRRPAHERAVPSDKHTVQAASAPQHSRTESNLSSASSQGSRTDPALLAILENQSKMLEKISLSKDEKPPKSLITITPKSHFHDSRRQ